MSPCGHDVRSPFRRCPLQALQKAFGKKPKMAEGVPALTGCLPGRLGWDWDWMGWVGSRCLSSRWARMGRVGSGRARSGWVGCVPAPPHLLSRSVSNACVSAVSLAPLSCVLARSCAPLRQRVPHGHPHLCGPLAPYPGGQHQLQRGECEQKSIVFAPLWAVCGGCVCAGTCGVCACVRWCGKKVRIPRGCGVQGLRTVSISMPSAAFLAVERPTILKFSL